MKLRELYNNFWKHQAKGLEKEYNSKNFVFPDEIKKIADIQYSNSKTDNVFDLYFPRASKKAKLPVIIYVHGGGYVSGNKKYNQKFCNEYARHDFAVACINYRKINTETEFIDSLSDVYSAILYIQNFAKDMPFLDVDNLILMGDSAGGHLASLIACVNASDKLRKLYGYAHKLNIKACVFHSSVFEIFKFRFLPTPNSIKQLFLNNNEFKLHYRLTSTLQLMNSDFPPCVCVSSKFDPLRNQTVQFVKACKRNNVSIDFISVNTMLNFGHDFQVRCVESKIAKKVNTLAIQKLNNILEKQNNLEQENADLEQENADLQ